MAKQKRANDPVADKLEMLTRVTQDLFILQALIAGAKVDAVRKALKIDKWRVSHISKTLRLKDTK